MRDIEAYANRYSLESFEPIKVRFRRNRILQIIREYSSISVLEIGCGLEPLFIFDNDENRRWTIVEPSKKFYDNAMKLSQDYKNVRCIQGFFEEVLEELNDVYDMIICSGLLHEVEDPERLVKALVECSEKDTVVHINVPNANSFHRLLGVEMGVISDKHEFTENNILAQQNSVFDVNSLNDIVVNNGLRVIDEGSFFIKPFSHSQMLKMLKTGIIGEKELEGLDSLSSQMPEYGSEIYVNCKKNFEN